MARRILNLRVEEALLARAEALVTRVSAAPELSASVQSAATLTQEPVRADVLRLALERGVAQLEAELRQPVLPGAVA